MNTAETKPVWTITHKFTLAIILAIQFVVAYVVGTQGLLVNTQQSMIPPIAITVIIPVVLFLAAYAMSKSFRKFVLAQDIQTLTMLQHWRVLGFGFLLLYAHGVLPGLFAWPAGLGDVAIGFAAPLIIIRLQNNLNYETSSALVRYHYLGLLDFAVAVITVGITAGSYAFFTPDGLTSAAMDVWPLNLFPSFGVPIFIILHLSVLLKVREFVGSNKSSQPAWHQMPDISNPKPKVQRNGK